MDGTMTPVKLLDYSKDYNRKFENSVIRLDLIKMIDRFKESDELGLFLKNLTKNQGDVMGEFLAGYMIYKCYGDNWGSMRSIILSGEYQGDDVVPISNLIKNFTFDAFSSKEVILRSDEAICSEYSYSNHLAAEDKILPEGASYSRIIGHNTNTFANGYNSDKPSIVCCVVPDKSNEWGKYFSYNEIPGYRYLKVTGFSSVLPYHLPNYSQSHPLNDHRRTLYWNPDLLLDENGEATIQFYNNGTCKQLFISGEGISEDGKMIICK